jgi:metal-responsive CopG/Arc/MetJ family transcriptional regulator
MDIRQTNVTFTVRLPVELAQLIDRECEDGVTRSVDVIEAALREYFERREALNPRPK